LFNAQPDSGFPLFWENTFTLSFNQNTTFVILKEINDFSFGNNQYFSRLFPVVEQYLADWVSARLGIEGSMTLSPDPAKFGYGVLGGFTFRLTSIGMDIDLNVTYLNAASGMANPKVKDLMYNDLFVLLNFSWNKLFVSR
jgi:hypothetical protein